jgi:ankyrin repeat protein
MTDSNGYTSLHWACLLGAYQAVRYLLANGADPNRVSVSDSATPVLLAMKNMEENREPRIIHKLLIYGGDPNFISKNGESC